jgi:ATP-dependent helicase HrpB
LLAVAFPERLAQARGSRGRFRMANGSGARLDEADPLADAPFLAIGEVQGGGPDARILLAAPIDRPSIERCFPGRIRSRRRSITILPRTACARCAPPGSTLSCSRRRHGRAERRSEQRAPGDCRAGAWPRGASLAGRPHQHPRADRFPSPHDPTWPDLSDILWPSDADEWLVPAFLGKRGSATLAQRPPQRLRGAAALVAHHDLDRLAPAEFTAPSGKRASIDYSSGEPVVRMAVQNLFGLWRASAVLGGAAPILFELLSPAGRPIQVTRDLPAFWAGSWRDVRADMRGRYPKHHGRKTRPPPSRSPGQSGGAFSSIRGYT